ncbi:fatty acid desaturase [Polaribacter irgensii 23-P]|jgi:stearoyl-CoA desaturase (delta-9 desaturase)|uniref:Fatty acid desaturase n=1 Tax=Polaribacter irgensii 23-P TaxID=313594 RepID=A4C0G0_9FLAO|nr:acyl-CoA desaturase [Polaribacter irgensii]EAR12903.1 fatty acid desaturase [Polaribacter irgensii 23-P]
MIIVIFILVLWYGGLFFQSFFLHRYAAHQVFTMSKTMERISFILTWFFQGSSYLSAYGYGIMHRMHHAYTDTEKDPHSPSHDPNLFAMMWKTKTIYQDINDQNIVVDEKFTKNVPQWKSFDAFASSRFSRLLWISFYILFFAYFTTALWQWALLPVALLMAPIHGVIINWFGHIYGYVNYKMTNTSKNLFPFDFLMMGEGYHNNHHKHASSANFGIKWHEVDVTYVIMKVLHFLGCIQLKSIPAKR